MIRTPSRLRNILASDDGVAAVEFAIVLPLFLTLVFGIIIYGSYFAVVHGVQQLAAEAARSSVAGITNDERTSLAQNYVTMNAKAYPLISAGRLQVSAAPAQNNGNVFVVTINYDASDMVIYTLPSFVPSPPSRIVRSAAIQRGGY